MTNIGLFYFQIDYINGRNYNYDIKDFTAFQLKSLHSIKVEMNKLCKYNLYKWNKQFFVRDNLDNLGFLFISVYTLYLDKFS